MSSKSTPFNLPHSEIEEFNLFQLQIPKLFLKVSNYIHL